MQFVKDLINLVLVSTIVLGSCGLVLNAAFPESARENNPMNANYVAK